MRPFALISLIAAAVPTLAATPTPPPEPRCAATAPRMVVELYTSEGCSSCPPADDWLAALPRDGSVLALAFHVDYWDHLGWPDRFADAAYTRRQQALRRPSGARFVYTPQLIVGGRDFPGWRQLAASALPAQAQAALPADAPGLTLRREGGQFVVEVGASKSPSGGTQLAGYLAGYWAWLEDGHESRVRAGENAGRALHHAHVVRRYQPVAPWPANEARTWRWPVPATTAGHAAQVVFVVTDGHGDRPLQARQLPLAETPGC